MFAQRPTVEQNPYAFSPMHDFEYDNLVVSGCSFTYNNSDQHVCAWPYYLKELGNFEKVYDCSLPGAGNYHIAHSLQWELGEGKLDPKNTLVIVMWSGNRRDDLIGDINALKDYPAKYCYLPSVSSIISGGHQPAFSNTKIDIKNIFDIKNQQSRSVENFLYRDSLKTWLDYHGYCSVFLEYLDRSLPNRTTDFDIRPYLPPVYQKRLDEITNKCLDPYSFCLKNDLLYEDDFHPSADGHLEWTKKILVPFLQSLNI
jgi:hypothetical protein